MTDWIDDVREGLKDKDRIKQRAEELRLRRADIMNSRSFQVFEHIKSDAKRAVSAIKSERSGFSELRFQERNAGNFEVSNLEYPAIWVDIQLMVDGIRFEQKTLRDLQSEAIVKTQQIDLGLDESEKLTLTFKGERLAAVRDAMGILLDPVLRLADPH